MYLNVECIHHSDVDNWGKWHLILFTVCSCNVGGIQHLRIYLSLTTKSTKANTVLKFYWKHIDEYRVFYKYVHLMRFCDIFSSLITHYCYYCLCFDKNMSIFFGNVTSSMQLWLFNWYLTATIPVRCIGALCLAIFISSNKCALLKLKLER